MNSALFRLTRRYTRRRLLQSALFVLGVALGVAVGVAIDLANTSASRAFSLSVNTVTGRTTHQIVGASGSLPTSVYTGLRNAGLRTSAPVIQAYVQALSLDNRPLRLLGIDPLAEAPFRDYLTPANAPDSSYQSGLFAFMTRPNTALVSDVLAERFGLAAGDHISIRTPTRTSVDVEIVGVLHPGSDVNAQALNDILLTDIATAQELAGTPGRITRIDLILPPEFDLDALRALLPPEASLTTPAASQNTLSQMTDAFELNLQALSLLALLVGVFLIYNTVTFSVVQRRAIIGILRSLGTTRRQIFVLILAEALILGMVGTLLGLGLGIVLGQGTIRLVAQTINDLYFRVNVEDIALSPTPLIKGMVIGMTASIVAALIPSYEATRTPPAGVMRRSTAEQSARRMLPVLAIGAIVLIASGIGLLQISTRSLTVSFAALFLVMIGAALLTPLATILAMRLATPVMNRVFGILGRMAPRFVTRTLSRTAVAITALTLAVSVIVGVSVMIDSFRTTLLNWLDITLGADIYISPYDDSSGSVDILIDPAIKTPLAAVEGVATVASVRSTTAIAPNYPDLPPINLVAADHDITGGKRRFAWLNTAYNDFWSALEAGELVVSEPFAYHRHITPEHNTLTLLTTQGEHTFTVAGVYYDYTSDQGAVLMYAGIYQEFFDDPYLTAVALELSDDANPTQVLETLQTSVLVGTGLEAQSNQGLRADIIAVFDRTFSITVALRLLATIVAFIGILSALLSLQLEQTRQYGIMRANGLTPRQLGLFTHLQTGLIGATAGILAAPIGILLAIILIEVINVRSFGWSMELTLHWKVFAQAFLVALIAALTAGLYPIWRLSRLAAAEALRSE